MNFLDFCSIGELFSIIAFTVLALIFSIIIIKEWNGIEDIKYVFIMIGVCFIGGLISCTYFDAAEQPYKKLRYFKSSY